MWLRVWDGGFDLKDRLRILGFGVCQGVSCCNRRNSQGFGQKGSDIRISGRSGALNLEFRSTLRFLKSLPPSPNA